MVRLALDLVEFIELKMAVRCQGKTASQLLLRCDVRMKSFFCAASHQCNVTSMLDISKRRTKN